MEGIEGSVPKNEKKSEMLHAEACSVYMLGLSLGLYE